MMTPLKAANAVYILRFVKRYPYLFQLGFSFLVSLLISAVYLLSHLSLDGDASLPNAQDILPLLLLGGVTLILFPLLMIYPWVLVAYQLILFVRALRWRARQCHRPYYDTWVLGFLGVCQFLYLVFMKEVIFSAGWKEQLINLERHSPLAPTHYLWFLILGALCLLSLCVLWVKPVSELPPLVPVLAIGVLYIATVYMALWTVQIYEPYRLMDIYLLLPGITFALIVAKTIAITVQTHALDMDRSIKLENSSVLARLNYYVEQAKTWPAAAFLLALPALGVIYAVLILLGQGPHALIRAFTDTSGWNLSQQTSPPNVFYDEHYLCTVAAGGHQAVVKPIRSGIRHGHTVTVNRQLLVANAFEEVISDRLPGVHRRIRHFYDQYGFNLAQRITTKWAADIVWVLMKPAEWVFLAVIYLCVCHPEDLINMQYTGIRYRTLNDLN